MRFLKDLLFPRVCGGCGAIGSFICLSCQKKLIFLPKQRCFYCRKASLYGYTHPLCRKVKGVDGIISIYTYTTILKKLLKSTKYRLAKETLDELLTLVTEPIGTLLFSKRTPYKNLVLQPIPLHPARLRQRGFNQAEVIAKFLHVLNGSKTIDLLVRSQNNPPQAQMKTKEQRFANTRSIFRLKEGKHIPKEALLIDDIVTTGSTVREAARVLKQSGVKEVHVFSLAQG